MFRRRPASTQARATPREIEPFQVVGDEDRVGRGRELARSGRRPLLDRATDLRIALVVDPRDLLVARGDDAQLPRRAALGVHDEAAGVDCERAEVGP